MSSAALQIIHHAPPWEWSWRFQDERGSLQTEASLHPMRPDHQILLEREELARRIRGDELRRQMTDHLRELLTEELAEALERSPARTLTVAGQRPDQMALSLPFELIFGREDAGAIVVRKVVPSRRQPEVPAAQTGRMVTAFPLTADQHYLPLHLEADLLARHAASAGMALDELFVCFTGEDVLRAARGASIVHLAGHGAEGALRCEWRERAAATLTSHDLIEAWRDESPRLVVLGFCQSSSERDDLRSARVAARGEMTIEEYAARLAPTAQAPSSSMAFDLVSALPTAVIGMRTNADDTEARRFLDAFYAAHLSDGLDIEGAYGRALAECDFVDGVGLPVPALYVGGEAAPHEKEPPEGQPGTIRCLPPDVRRIVNTTYQATSSLGPAIGGSWGCRINGANEALRLKVAQSVLITASAWREIQGIPGASPALAVTELKGEAIEAVCPPMSRARPISAVRIDLNRWSQSVTMGELLSASSEAEPHELRLLARATCDVPALVSIVLLNGVDALAGALAQKAEKASPGDWDLACALLNLLPEQHAVPIRRWSDERWSAVEAIGQPAIDLVAAFTSLLDGESLLEDDQPAVTAIHLRTGIPMEEPGLILGALGNSGIISFGTGPLQEQLTETLSCDRMTAQRALRHCSHGATEALALVEVERELDRLPSIDTVESLTTPNLARLCELCLICDHPELDSLLKKLAGREDGREAARELQERRGVGSDTNEEAGPAATDRDWGAWDALIQAGRFEEAAALIDELEAAGVSTDHPLRIEANRLITRLPDPDQESLLRDARALEQRILTERVYGKESAAQIEVLLVVREAISSALHRLDRMGEAGEVLLEHFRETMKSGARPSACAYAGAHAIREFCLNDEPDRAREICDVLAPLVSDLAPSSATILVHSAELELLAAEGRSVHAIAAAEELLREIGEWDAPRPDQVRGAFPGLGGAFAGTDRGVAVLALNYLTGREPSPLGDDRVLRLTHTWPEVDANEAVVAADELFSLMPKAMEAFGMSRSDLRQGTRTFAEKFLQLSKGSGVTGLLGREGERILTARAEAGCPLSERILEAARAPGVEEDPAAAPQKRKHIYDAAIARDHPRLKVALREILPETFQSILALLPEALNGNRDARLAWAAMTMDDSEEDQIGPESYALLAIAKGDVQATWSALRHVEGPRPTMAICVAIEEYCLWPGKRDAAPTPVPEAIAALSRTAWESALDQAPDRAASARAAHHGLGSAFMSIQNVLSALLVAHRCSSSLTQVGGAREEEPLTRHVFELLWKSSETQLALAELTIDAEPQQSEEAFELLGVFALSEDPQVSMRAKLSRLTAAARRKEKHLLEPALDDLLQCLEELESGDPRRIPLLNSATLAALELERSEAAIDCARDLLTHPLSRADGPMRFEAFNLLFRCLVADGQMGAAADLLAEAGAEMGFSVACLILDWFPEAFDTNGAARFAEVMLPLAEAEDPLVDSPPLRSARMKFLERIGDVDAWALVRAAATLPEEA